MHPATDHISFKLRSPSLSASSVAAQFKLALKSPGLDVRVMQMATQILNTDPVQHSISISFDDVAISPSLITDKDFRSFAELISIAMPSWPTLLTKGNSLTPLLILAPIPNLSICHYTETDTWGVTVPREQLKNRFSVLAEYLGRGFTDQKQREMLLMLIENLGE